MGDLMGSLMDMAGMMGIDVSFLNSVKLKIELFELRMDYITNLNYAIFYKDDIVKCRKYIDSLKTIDEEIKKLNVKILEIEKEIEKDG